MDAPTPTPPAAPSRAAIDAAVDELRHDPNLGTDTTVKSLRWVSQAKQKPEPQPAPAWIAGLFKYLTQGAAGVLWLGGAIAVGIAAIWSYRVYRSRAPAGSRPVPRPASRVHDLDIRPESLPEDVGGAALALLDAGRTREALSLLYRGALSRAVHRFSVAIGESYTEAEAFNAVSRSLPPTGVQYFSALLASWQRTVYAAEPASSGSVAALCRSFAAALDGPIHADR